MPDEKAFMRLDPDRTWYAHPFLMSDEECILQTFVPEDFSVTAFSDEQVFWRPEHADNHRTDQSIPDEEEIVPDHHDESGDNASESGSSSHVSVLRGGLARMAHCLRSIARGPSLVSRGSLFV